jgi:hypothetical protein
MGLLCGISFTDGLQEMELLNSLGKLSCIAIERAAISNMRRSRAEKTH